MKFKVGDKVKITSTSKYYSEDTPHNPKNVIGEITKVLSSTIYVKWPTFDDTNCYLEDDLELYEEPIMKKEKVKPQTFCITGNKNALKYLAKELKELGYSIESNYVGGCLSICMSNGTAKDELEHITSLIFCASSDPSRDLDFKMPEDADRFLKFAKENLEIAKEYFKPEEPEFKVGQWIYREEGDSKDLGRFSHVKNTILHASEVYCIKNNYLDQQFTETICVGIAPGAWKVATPEQIERILTIVAKEKGFKEGVKIHCVNRETIELDDYSNIRGEFNYRKDVDCLNGGNGNVYCKGLWAEIVKETFPQIEIAGYKAEFTDKTVNFGCNHIPKETFISLYEMINSLPGRNELISMDMKYDSYAFNLDCDQITKIAKYYLKK